MGAFEDYAEAVAAFKKASSTLDKYASDITAVGNNLSRSRATFHFSNAQGGFPAEVVMGRGSPSFNGREWPTADAINLALTHWHECRNKLQNVWHSLPKDQKDALQPPPREAMIR